MHAYICSLLMDMAMPIPTWCMFIAQRMKMRTIFSITQHQN